MSATNWADCPKCGAKEELREDYEIGFYKKEFFVIYESKCMRCNFGKKFKHEEII